MLNDEHFNITYDSAYATSTDTKKILLYQKAGDIKKKLKAILEIGDSILNLILENLTTETRNTIPIKDLARDTLDRLEEKDNSQIDIDKILDNLTTISRYGTALIENGKLTEKYIILQEQLLNLNLKDTSIIISETGVKKGDNLVIKIKNDEREFNIKILIKEFGFKKDIIDSYLYVQRCKDASKKFTPMSGVTLQLLFIPRIYNDELSNSWADKYFLSLTPGFGINVSFPQDKDNHTQVSTGVVLSLFNNAIFITRGTDLTTEERKKYYGIGFSFVDIAGKIMSINKN